MTSKRQPLWLESASKEEIDRLLRRADEEEHRVERGDADEAYRFSRTGGMAFGDHVSVLVERRGARVMLVGEAWFKHRVVKPLDAAEWERLREAIDGARFFEMPKRHDRWGFDGWDLTVEGRRDGRYHSSTGWCPESGEPLHDLGRVFIELAGFDDVPAEQMR